MAQSPPFPFPGCFEFLLSPGWWAARWLLSARLEPIQVENGRLSAGVEDCRQTTLWVGATDTQMPLLARSTMADGGDGSWGPKRKQIKMERSAD